jgi:hypothetical protein
MTTHPQFIAQVNDALGGPLVEPDPTPPHGTPRPAPMLADTHIHLYQGDTPPVVGSTRDGSRWVRIGTPANGATVTIFFDRLTEVIDLADAIVQAASDASRSHILASTDPEVTP